MVPLQGFRGEVLLLLKLPVLIKVVATITAATAVIVAEVVVALAATAATLVAFKIAATTAAVSAACALFEIRTAIIKMNAVSTGFVNQFAARYFGKLILYHVVVHWFFVPVGVGQLHVVAYGLRKAVLGVFILF